MGEFLGRADSLLQPSTKQSLRYIANAHKCLLNKLLALSHKSVLLFSLLVPKLISIDQLL